MAELFNDLDEFKKFVSVNQSFFLESIEASIFHAARKYIVIWLSATEYTNLVNAHAAATMSTAQQNLLPFVQRALANFAIFEYLPMAAVNVTDSGITRQEGEDRKSAYKYQEKALADSLCEIAWDNLELMLAFLEENSTDYPDWAASDSYKMNKELFINSASEFMQGYHIFQGRKTFEVLRTLIDTMECFSILPCIGKDYFDELKDQIMNKNLTDPNKAALKIIRKALAYFTIKEGLRQNWIVLTASGVQSKSSLEPQSYEARNTANQGQMTVAVMQAEEIANRNISKLMNLLIENTDYPTFNTWYDAELAAAEEAEKEEECTTDEDDESAIYCV